MREVMLDSPSGHPGLWGRSNHALGPEPELLLEESGSVRGPGSEEERGREIAGRDCWVAELYCAVLEEDG